MKKCEFIKLGSYLFRTSEISVIQLLNEQINSLIVIHGSYKTTIEYKGEYSATTAIYKKICEIIQPEIIH